MVVSAAEPAMERLTVPIAEHPQVEPFQSSVARVKVEQVVYDPQDLAEVGAVLTIGSGSLESRLSLHTRYHVEGISKSPIIPMYESPLCQRDQRPQRWVALVRRCRVAAVSLCYTVDYAMETTDALKRIEKLRRQRR
ncbi:MAG: hypothetical protein KTR31_07335 [Myxococcales bacterium]|nr:hypothetical protein [Myxococcales bacterium]